MSYLEGHENSGLKVGDIVKVTRKSESNERGWSNSWIKDMNKFIGKECKIILDNNDRGFRLELNGEQWNFPCFVLSNRYLKIKKILE